MSIGEFAKTYLNVKLFNIKQQFFVVRTYYKKKLRFCLIDLVLLFIYFFVNPYRVSKKFLKKRNFQNIHVYGETPLATFEQIVKKCEISSDHFFLEMGAGRGRSAFWLSEFVGCRVCAVEWIPLFHNISLFISKIFRFKGLTLVKDDMFNMDFRNFDIIFLYGTCLDDGEIYLLIEKLKKAGEKVKIITISYPLSAYDPSYSTIIHFPVLFPWGTTDCYLNQRTFC